jgi:Alr-MurF fusion protein
MEMRFSQLEEITNGHFLQFHADLPIHHLLIDSRKVVLDKGSIFFAIEGDRYDGHQFIDELYIYGVRQFVVGKEINLQHMPLANVIKVDLPIDALQKVAKIHREQFKIPVVGITGSNGKTIVKEWLFQLLSPDYSITKNPGSYNSQVGVPLSVWRIQPEDQLGIFEAGISLPHEMQKLRVIIQPTLGIITNIGSAHDEGFQSAEQKLDEKLQLFDNCEKVIFCADQLRIAEKIHKSGLPGFSWSMGGEADVTVKANGSDYLVSLQDMEFKLDLSFSDKASIENIFHCITLMLFLRYHPSVIADRIRSLRSVPMRLELKAGINRCQIIDDSYNNDLMGLQISLDFLLNQRQRTRKGLILSDIHQSGLPDEELALRIAEMIKQSGLDTFVAIGPVLSGHQHLFPGFSEFYPTTESFLEQHNLERFHDEVILIKGARAFQFERIANRIQRSVHGTVMEIDLGALVHNLNYFRAHIPDDTKLMVMVKALAYGSGSNEIANVLQYHKVDYLGVAYTDEGVDLRMNNIEVPIMVMNPAEEGFDLLQRYHLEPEIYSAKILRSLIEFLKLRACVIHLKLDTGMHRLGFEEGDLDQLIEVLRENRNIEVGSIFSHLAGADLAEHDAFSIEQGRRFALWSDKISRGLGYKPLYHILNTPGILRLPSIHFDMVRLGIGLYGIDPTGMHHDLQTVVTLKTIISQIKHLKKGDTIGYGRSGVADRDLRTATLAIGYADGFSRTFGSGNGHVLINGNLAPVLGNVCMDMTMVDITGIEASEGDEAIIFGRQLSIESVAASINTIPYEILTNTSDRVKRVFVAESI